LTGLKRLGEAGEPVRGGGESEASESGEGRFRPVRIGAREDLLEGLLREDLALEEEKHLEILERAELRRPSL